MVEEGSTNAALVLALGKLRELSQDFLRALPSPKVLYPDVRISTSEEFK